MQWSGIDVVSTDKAIEMGLVQLTVPGYRNEKVIVREGESIGYILPTKMVLWTEWCVRQAKRLNTDSERKAVIVSGGNKYYSVWANPISEQGMKVEFRLSRPSAGREK